MILLYDDTQRMPDEIRGLIRQKHFGDLMDGGQCLHSRLQQAAEQTGLPFQRLRIEAHKEEFLTEHHHEHANNTFCIWPSHIAPPSTEAACDLLKRIQYLDVPTNLRPSNSHTNIQLISAQHWRKERDSLENKAAVVLKDTLFDLSNITTCIRFLSGAFRTRHFNSIISNENTIVKKSRHHDKMRAEHDFYYLLPPAFQRYFIQPYDFKQNNEYSSYEMERLMIPDVSILWTHQAFNQHEFESFLERAFDFLERRPRFPASRLDVRNAWIKMHQNKLDTRNEMMQKWKGYRTFDGLLKFSIEGGYTALCRRWEQWHQNLSPTSYDHLCIGHGDFCHSNILYDKRTSLFKLVDPRGAREKKDLAMHPGYDLAKLSHSILGGYDFIVKELYKITISSTLEHQLIVEDKPLRDCQNIFLNALQKRGLDWRIIRLEEAGLFLSMLPLHIDDPRRVLAFALNADRILGSIEKNIPIEK